ncbi:11199_t:CDS:2, partial [Funneliformis mosseae]
KTAEEYNAYHAHNYKHKKLKLASKIDQQSSSNNRAATKLSHEFESKRLE